MSVKRPGLAADLSVRALIIEDGVSRRTLPKHLLRFFFSTEAAPTEVLHLAGLMLGGSVRMNSPEAPWSALWNGF